MSGLLAGKVALVTGASRGIGAAVARRFAAEGARLVLLARSEGALAEQQDAIKAASGLAAICPLDLLDFDQVDALGPSLAARYGGLDILVAAAGSLGTLTPLGHLSVAEWERCLALNLSAPWRLIRTLDPLLRGAAAGRAVFVADAISETPRAYWGAYAAAKAGQTALVRAWAEETRKTPLKINLIDPGPVATRLRAEAYPGEDPSTLKRPEAVAGAFLSLVAPACQASGKLFRWDDPTLAQSPLA
ncbi:MAG: SDR family NAD(P)-dependent oxidoreductase [Alphaproteobacteria bacterium]|nr:SDR family NAD(P)-dependent oxidoreductase [Alphaproteobacteria bacterium]